MLSRLVFVFAFLVAFANASQAQDRRKPLTVMEICHQRSSAIVAITTERGLGTGFIVDPDGWIITASHVVIDPHTKASDNTIAVTLADKSVQIAKIFPSKGGVSRDFAILKIEKANLPFVELGDEDEVEIGSPLVIIGFPFSVGPMPKFCLSGQIAARDTIKAGKVDVEVIYFQGVSVKGISGSPVFSVNSGSVIGVVNLKLAGITEQLEQQGAILASSGSELMLGGVSIGKTLGTVIDILDRQLANGLGAATGINDAKFALRSAKRQNSANHH